MTNEHGVRSIATERRQAHRLQAGSQERAVAELYADILAHIKACQDLRAVAARHCTQIDAIEHGVPNRSRPYLRWECCDAHRALKAEREKLQIRATELGEKELVFNVSLVIID